VLARIPVRNNHDDRYFTDKYQALPKHGYTKFIESLTNHSNITIKTGVDYFDLSGSNFETVIYTGPIDAYFGNVVGEKLEYRSIKFVKEDYKNIEGYYQPNSVVNYPGTDVEFTRIVEYKHFLNQKSPHTTIVKEYSTDEGEPYYPVLNAKNLAIYEKYKKLAEGEKNVHFIGRLANYKYFNMDQAIKNALDYFNNNFV
jgi:UDP-galactopyranose mutase